MKNPEGRTFASPCGPIAVSRKDGRYVVELLDTAGPQPYDYPEFFYAESWGEIHRVLEERRELADLADRGRWLKDREDDELTALHVGADVSRFLADVIPSRAADRARAGVVLRTLLRAGHVVRLKHGAARCEPAPPPELAGVVEELQPYLCDLLDEGEAA